MACCNIVANMSKHRRQVRHGLSCDMATHGIDRHVGWDGNKRATTLWFLCLCLLFPRRISVTGRGTWETWRGRKDRHYIWDVRLQARTSPLSSLLGSAKFLPKRCFLFPPAAPCSSTTYYCCTALLMAEEGCNCLEAHAGSHLLR